MKVAPRNIESFVAKPDPKARAILIYGPDEGLVRERMKALGKTVTADLNDPFNVAELSGPDLVEDPARLSDEANAMSMMGGARLIMIRGGGDKNTPALKSYLEDPSAENLILIEGGALGPKSPLRKLCEQSDSAAALPCYVDDERDLGRLIRGMLLHAGYDASPDAVAYLSQSLVGDRQIMRGEIEKLITYMGVPQDYQGPDGPAITRTGTTIELDDALACVGNSADMSLDDIARHTANGNFTAMNRVLNHLFEEGIAPVAILRATQNYFRRLHLVQSLIANGENMDGAIKKLQPPVFFKLMDDFKRQLQGWNLNRLSLALSELAEAEAKCKTTGYPDQTLCARILLSLSHMNKKKAA